MIYLSGVLEIELIDGRQVLAVAAWLSEGSPAFLGMDPETHEPVEFTLLGIKRINAVLVR
jgi:hypothetical protein